jgi:hypothetical protein
MWDLGPAGDERSVAHRAKYALTRVSRFPRSIDPNGPAPAYDKRAGPAGPPSTNH